MTRVHHLVNHAELDTYVVSAGSYAVCEFTVPSFPRSMEQPEIFDCEEGIATTGLSGQPLDSALEIIRGRGFDVRPAA